MLGQIYTYVQLTTIGQPYFKGPEICGLWEKAGATGRRCKLHTERSQSTRRFKAPSCCETTAVTFLSCYALVSVAPSC